MNFTMMHLATSMGVVFSQVSARALGSSSGNGKGDSADQSHVIGGGVGDENSEDGKEPTSPEMPDPMEVIVIAAAVILFCFLV